MAITMLLAASGQADLLVTSEPVEVLGQKAIVKMDMRNTFKRKVESARAAVFVMDPHGKVVGHAVQWVITGRKGLPALPPGGTNNFNFVIPLTEPVGTANLSTKVQFVRVVLDHGRLANIPTEVTVEENSK